MSTATENACRWRATRRGRDVDERMRELERAARAGDHHARLALMRETIRRTNRDPLMDPREGDLVATARARWRVLWECGNGRVRVARGPWCSSCDSSVNACDGQSACPESWSWLARVYFATPPARRPKRRRSATTELEATLTQWRRWVMAGVVVRHADEPAGLGALPLAVARGVRHG